jgi:hypothetical protein
MVKELKVDSADTPTIGRGSVIMFLTLASVFGVIAIGPFTPSFDSLTKEEAHIQKVWKDSHASTTTNLKTISGRDVKCMQGKFGGCYPETMKSFLENKTPVMVWHDGEKVYQLTAQEKLILPYEHFHQGRWFSGVVSIISLLIAFIQVAILKGFIGVASTKNGPKT